MGKSWLSAAAHVVPFLQGYMTGQGWLRESPSQWLTYTYWGRHASGRAFTLAAEGYLNFGYAGTVVELLAMGCFMRWLVIQFSRRPSATRGLIFLGCLGPSILVIRSHLNLFIAPVVFIMIGAVLLDWMLGHESGPRFRRTTGSHPPAASLPRPVMLSR